MRTLSLSDQIQDTFNQYLCSLISQDVARKKIKELQEKLGIKSPTT